MQSQAAALQALSPQLPMLARACGRTLLLAFLVLVVAAALPLQPRSLAWATQISSRIIDTASFPLLGVALLRFATFLEPSPDPLTERREALAWAQRRDLVIRLAWLGVVSLFLLAVWQIPLLLGSFTSLDQQNVARAGQLNQRISQGEQSIRQAPPAQIQSEWQRLQAAGAPGITAEIRDPERKRQILLAQLEQEQQQLGRTLGSQNDQSRFVAIRNSLRILALCAIYIAGFQAIARRRA